RLVLIGDGGEPGRDDPTLALLSEWSNAHPKRTSVVFLGDNIYPAGLPGRGRGRERGQEILLEQLRATSARAMMIPRNHDWGWARGFPRDARRLLANEQKFVQANGAEFAPERGCPGPVTIELAPSTRQLAGGLTLIALDLNWWLLPESARPVCEGI